MSVKAQITTMQKIEKLRKRLDAIANEDNLTTEKVNKLSKKLDELIVVEQKERAEKTA